MKKILTLVYIAASITTFAQTIIPGDGIKKSGDTISIEGRLNTVANFSTFTGNTIIVEVMDTLRGGKFNIYSGTEPTDNGMIFTDGSSRKWKRVQADNRVNIQWYGAIATTTGSNNDALAQIQAARDYCYTHIGSILYFPRTATGQKKYYVSATLSFADHDIIIEGDNIGSTGSNDYSVLKFPLNVVGLDFNETVNAAKYVTVKNLHIQGGGYPGAGGSDTFNITKHGIQINVNGNFENVYSNEFSGNGFQITGDGSVLGNSDRSQFINCEANYCNNGWYITGADANIIVFNNCSAIQCRRWGFYDNGFLGNNYINCHAATNAFQLFAPNFVKASYGGISYVAISEDDVNNTNLRPDLNPSKWQVYSSGAPAWDSTRRYYSGGPFSSTNINAFNVYSGNYSECCQPPSRYSSRSLVLGGLQEAGFSGGGNISASFGSTINHSPVTFNQPLSFGNIYGPQSSLSFNQSGATPASRYTDLKADVSLGNSPNIRMYGNGKTEFATNAFVIAPEGTQSSTLPNASTEYGYKYVGMGGFAGPTLIFGGAGYGYFFNLAKRTAGVTTPLFSVYEGDGSIFAYNLKTPVGTTKVVTADQEGRLFSNTTLPAGMTYPVAGIALSTGSAWGTSIADNSANWNTAYTDRLKWDGGVTGLTASAGRTSLGATTIGSNLFTLTDPSAITFPRYNADNTVNALSAAAFTNAIGAEPALGNPVTNGYVLSSTSAGVRSWAPTTDTRLVTGVVTNDVSNSSVTLGKITSLDKTLGVGVYQFIYTIRYQASATTTGIRFSVNHSGTTNFFIANMRWTDVSATASTAAPTQSGVLSTGQVTGAMSARTKSTTGWGATLSVDAANSDMLCIIEGTLEITASGDLQLYHSSEVAATSTVKAGTSVVITKVN